MTDIYKAAQMALEALEWLTAAEPGDEPPVNETIAALRAALAERELNLSCKSVQARLSTQWGYVKAEQQEPVAWIRPSGKAMLEAGGYCTVYASEGMSNHSTPLYTAPQPKVEQQELRSDGMPASRTERQLRRLLASTANLRYMYFDDGEAHGSEWGVAIDFMREPLEDIESKMRAINVARYTGEPIDNESAK